MPSRVQRSASAAVMNSKCSDEPRASPGRGARSRRSAFSSSGSGDSPAATSSRGPVAGVNGIAATSFG